MSIIARQNELALLKKINQTQEAAFVAVYGRRRVGKTYLIREFFSHFKTYFELSGMKDAPCSLQLTNFNQKFTELFYPHLSLTPPQTWREAFQRLTDEIAKTPQDQKIIIFFDELPWLASQRSHFLENLDYFWNSYWSKLKNLRLIVCGSAAAWMLDNVINATGGLHNRVTRSILLKPFTLRETAEFIKDRGLKLNEEQILDIYMTMGGVPYYLSQLERGKSAAQNINDIAFTEQGLLYKEFDNLFNSLFDKKDIYLDIIESISTTHTGVEREALLKSLDVKSGGTLKKRLDELEAAGFIETFIPYGRKIKGYYIRIIDEYTLFYLRWIKPLKDRNKYAQAHNYWQLKVNSPAWNAWAGYAFECVCFKHIPQIRAALHLESISSEIGCFRKNADSKSNSGAQIDLLFDRADNAITLCEIKYSQAAYSIDKTYAKNLMNKIDVFTHETQTKKQIFMTLITVQSLKKTLWFDELIDQTVLLSDLFRS